MVDQLQRASSSVALNVAEGSGEFSANEKIRFYRKARRSATECAGILDICMRLDLVDENMGSKSRSLLLRIVSMLTKMARPSSVTQAGMQTFTEMALRELFEFLKPKC